MGFLAEHIWLCGSPETVADKRLKLTITVGAFGRLCVMSHDDITTLSRRVSQCGASNAGTREGREVLELMASGAIKSEVTPITFEQIPENLIALGKGGVRGRYIAILP